MLKLVFPARLRTTLNLIQGKARACLWHEPAQVQKCNSAEAQKLKWYNLAWQTIKTLLYSRKQTSLLFRFIEQLITSQSQRCLVLHLRSGEQPCPFLLILLKATRGKVRTNFDSLSALHSVLTQRQNICSISRCDLVISKPMQTILKAFWSKSGNSCGAFIVPSDFYTSDF